MSLSAASYVAREPGEVSLIPAALKGNGRLLLKFDALIPHVIPRATRRKKLLA